MNLEKPTPDYNPYQTPETALYDNNTEVGELLDEPNSLPASSGMDWLKDAWAIFMARPLLWVGFTIFYFLALIVLSLIPIVGLIAGFVGTFVLAGVAYVAYQIDMDEPTSFGDLFMGFRHNVLQQVLLIVVNFVALIVFAVIFTLIATMLGVGVGSVLGEGANLVLVLIMLVGLLFYIPLVMCMYLAPILILFHDMSAVSAMSLSFKACLKNILPFLVLGILLIIAGLVAIIPFGLGLLVLMPVMMITSYTAYKQMLTTY